MEYFLRVKKRIFRALVEKRSYGFFITIGGKAFTKCMELSVSVSSSNSSLTPPIGILMQVKSEPECGYDSFLENGETPDMIKAGLQLCASIVPGLKLFRLNDDSNIECGKSRSSSPPRALGKPFALPQLSIAIYGKTWYERHFGAVLENERKYSAYRNAVEVLSTPIGIPFEQFAMQNVLTDEQADILKEPFNTATTWHDFFKAVPRNMFCNAFYNWLPFFINRILDDEFNNNGWVINIDTMQKVDMQIIPKPSLSGGKRTRRNNKKKVIFNSSSSHGLRVDDI